MNNQQDQLKLLEQKLEDLLAKQENFATNLMAAYREIEQLKKDLSTETPLTSTIKETTAATEPPTITNEVKAPADIPVEKIQAEQIAIPTEKQQNLEVAQKISDQAQAETFTNQDTKNETVSTNTSRIPETKSSLEKFIGENLINKVGILITIIGVIIGVKYSIENNLISPLTRIILGYLLSFGILGVGLKLKEKYLNFSAVLVSGAITMMYFITFMGYDFYGLFPQLLAFGIMTLLTIFTVVAAINYDKQVIAHLGLVGAYSIPFLLSNNSGNVTALFSYMTIINIGILIISFKKYWKSLYYVSFSFTWLIYLGWILKDYYYVEDFRFAFTFLSIFFILFYCMFLAYKTLKNEKFQATDVILLFINSFFFYGIGYYLLNSHETFGKELLGLFTLGNAVIHFIPTVIVYKKKLVDKKLFYLIAALVLTFITITIPVQLDGSWVTILWSAEAALLFWFATTKKITVYKNLSYILMVIAFISLLEDWSHIYDLHPSKEKIAPIFNSNFLSSVVVITAFGFITWLNKAQKFQDLEVPKKAMDKIMGFLIPVGLLLICYLAFSLEINMYWEQQFLDSFINYTNEDGNLSSTRNYNLLDFKSIWLINYSLLFFSILAVANIKLIKNRTLAIANFVINNILTFIFLIGGLLIISTLRENYVTQYLGEHYNIGSYFLYIRYISLAFLAFLVYTVYWYTKQDYLNLKIKNMFQIFLYFITLWILSSELLHWMDLAGASGLYKMNLSILWGAYSLFMVIIGIWKRKKHIRISGISLFGLTLVKLFFYDIADLDTISKTIVFVSLGLLLLLISFLYNKYTKQIENDPKDL
ncbi:Protein of unknown function DUF2339, transmembrane [Cellulophaga algicola DSM 14237]|uniref:DUF2339 domain-containing protein n=1 Tax=Cellulophaga algicola (strain DSM 14237 / IC166 / ACAM 630) TaxID=688270 RepID=E6X897_CELAD|nr:DUF2339 domain-containing protein [Cellulophaga algicola]ADV49723.1 Protein of unknown function DUF2339, transmembrane [Cellulophaga algicola DSM 14237]